MYLGLPNLGLSGAKNRYQEIQGEAIAAARRNNASLWYAGAQTDLTGFVWQDSAGTTPATGTDPIGRLTDRAGLNNATQVTAANKPTLELQANGYYGMRFDGVNDNLLSTLGLGGASDFTLTVAGIADASASVRVAAGTFLVANRAYVAQLATSNFIGGGAGTANQGGTFVSAINWQTTPSVASVRVSGTTAELYINGVLARSESTTTSGTGMPLTIGAGNNAGAVTLFFAGCITLVAAVPTVGITAADRISIERFAALLSGAAYA